MTDRYFPGSSPNSFLRNTGVLGGGEVTSLSDFSGTSKQELIKQQQYDYHQRPSDLQLQRINQDRELRAKNGEQGIKPLSYEKEATLSDIWKTLTSPSTPETTPKESFNFAGAPKSLLTRLNNAIAVGKAKITGQGKPEEVKTTTEAFCADHWCAVAKSVVVLIVVIFMTMSILAFLGIHKWYCSDGSCSSNYGSQQYQPLVNKPVF
jgi:hypothetical protein